MLAKIIDGKAIAAAITAQVRTGIQELGAEPGLGVVLVGDDPASHLYVGLKKKACAEAGIRFELRLLPATAAEDEVLAALEELNGREDIDAILVQLPLPKPLEADPIIARMHPSKDVDGFHPDTIESHVSGSGWHPPGLVSSIMALIGAAEVPLAGNNAVVVANSRVFYEPLAVSLRQAGLEPSFAQSSDPDLADKTWQADVLVTAVGKPGCITADMVKPGAVVIDVGTTRVGRKTVGDVAASVCSVAGAVSPVPGGVGPVTVAMLLRNTLELTKRRRAQK
ncbi:bifunctional 5,10-methylenetetrahydrofolate dehydrogenase/5,10-methenyltetrahydrofolate cyclohydrolase [Candidatus Uhrbacteria bacterium]|nr:bifunctional 5,10-methylenetetrahydrofolate dehydrogenase/5,10-methenyltetrahydrofolate cyclohydrolase [Candidatus Uhrbacteria bacterium]